MTGGTLPPATIVDTDAALNKLVARLIHDPQIAIDTESNSLHAYRERICLFQISTRNEDFIVDPLSIGDMQPLGELMANSQIEKIFHAAEYDIMCMKRDYGFTVVNLFDTMLAARVCGRKAVGLGSLLEEHAGIVVDKKHQRDDWGQRPLPRESLLYAQMDTHFLHMLRDKLYAELVEANRVIEAMEAFEELRYVPAADNHFDPNGYWKIGQTADLSRRQMAILRELYILRDKMAAERDRPPFKVFSDKTLIAIAEAAPRRIKQLEVLEGMTEGQVRRYGKQVLLAVEVGLNSKLPEPPARPPRAEQDVFNRYMALHNWRKERAILRGVESDVIISKETLWTLARKIPSTLTDLENVPGLGPWRLAEYGSDILDVIKRHENGS